MLSPVVTASTFCKYLPAYHSGQYILLTYLFDFLFVSKDLIAMINPLDTGCKLNVHKTFNFHPVSTVHSYFEKCNLMNLFAIGLKYLMSQVFPTKN